MKDDLMIQRLVREERPPEAPAARESLAAAARAVVSAPRPTGSHPVVRVAVAGTLVAAVVGLSFTPPGRAVTGEVASLVGIGEPATLDHSQDETLSSQGKAIVIANGATVDGERYELVAFEGRIDAPITPPAPDDQARDASTPTLPTHPGTCLKLDWIERASPNTGAVCSNVQPASPLQFDNVGEDNRQNGPARLLVEGMTGPEVAEVEVTYESVGGERVTADSTLGRIVGPLAEQLGAAHEFGWFVAFIPQEDIIRSGNLSDVRTKIEAVAYDEEGEEIARETFGDRG